MDDDDRVERTIELRASRSRVWQAINNPRDFGTWFGLGEPLRLEGDFVPGGRVVGVWPVSGREVRELFCTIEEVVPETLLAFRWVPYEIPEGDDPAAHATTRIEMRLEDCAIGTRLVVSEAGFAALPKDKQYKREQNAAGWEVQTHAIASHVLGSLDVGVEQHIARPPAEVFRAIAEPALLARYLGTPIGDVTIGQRTENAKLGFAWKQSGQPTKVTLDLVAAGAGTTLTIREAPFALSDDGARRALAQTSAWTRFGCRLAVHLEHGIGPRDGA